MPDDHRHAIDDDRLLAPAEEESSSVWMVSYIDVMTLLVALFVLLLSLSSYVDGDASEAQLEPGALQASMLTRASSLRLDESGHLGVPLPPGALRATHPPERPAPSPTDVTRIDPSVVVVAMGVGRPGTQPSAWVPPKVVAPVDLDIPESVGDGVVVITELTPEDTQELDPEVIDLIADLDDAPRVPDLDGVEVSRVEEGISLRVEDHLLFESGSGELIGSGEGLVDELVSIIERYEGEVSIEGHTDSRPINTESFPSNWELSSARAMAILRYLEAAGIEPTRLRAVGFGETRPLASNETAEGRERNRRVEVIVHL
ncbi:OmpA/MotB family protein [Aidingimonas halophila]|uniref:Chemotaxis protein MotB n=1 Tax=Aidingimonas halophila TaxID=574349 RepID=A0A1H3GAP8_9GAMM|nr:OmpA family protein [Aidingimonas halophila]GHC32879.1 hypothetical protein GCM10008094_27040 [Aidingimonas halophila]SDY00403.1 chemotaxis protein MotB [Aidingimonas halophila]